MTDLVATWKVPLGDGVHVVEFEHGTTTGKRVIRVDGKEIYRVEWMFKLVGTEYFEVGKQKAKCVVNISAVDGFAYEYTMEVNGKSLEHFTENRSKVQCTWCLPVKGIDTRIVLANQKYLERDVVVWGAIEKDTLDVWVNGQRVETAGEFTDDGTETHFEVHDRPAYIKAVSSGKRRDGLIHQLFINGELIPPEAN